MSSYDVIVVGGGIVGVVTALGLAQQTELKIAIVDSQPVSPLWLSDEFDHRVSAISHASQRIFNHLNAWNNITSKRLNPYTRMYVWDDQSSIQFHCDDLHCSSLGFIIEDKVIRSSLVEVLQTHSNVDFFSSTKFISLTVFHDNVTLVTEHGETLNAQLVIGADGAHSWVRSQTGIDLDTLDYQHTALVAQVTTALSHENTAWQRFTQKGPIAFLPFTEAKTSSIVWSTLPEEAERLINEDDEKFKKSLEIAFDHRLGEILKVDRRYHYPLKMRHAKNYVLPRIALVGDAAHTLHPLAGQGVNLGLLDAACLVDVIYEAFLKHRDFSALHTLRKYERWRKGHNLMMLKMVGLLKHLFMNEKAFIQSLRAFGLNFTDQVSFLKNFLANYAVGNNIDLPLLAK